MVLQTKEMSNVKLYYKISWKEEVEIDFTSSLEQDKALFQMSEYERLEMRVEGLNEDIEVMVESFQGDSPIVLTNEPICLTEEVTANETSVIPGIYAIRLTSKDNGARTYYFEVTSHNLSMNQLELMRTALESRVTGITRDFNTQREVLNNKEAGLVLSSEFGLMMQHHEELENALERIINSPIEDLTKAYGLRDVSRKQSARSERWLASKGQKYKEQGKQTMFYEARPTLTLDTIENRTLKQNLNEIMVILIRVTSQYRFIESGIVAQINQLRTDIANAKRQQKTLSESYNVARIKVQIENEIISKRKELEVLKKQRASTLDNQRKLKGLATKLNTALNETWIREVKADNKTRLTNRAFKNTYYHFVYELAQSLLLTQKNRNKETTLVFPFLETTKLFEFYNVILCVDLLEVQGFKWTKGWIKDQKWDRKMLCSLTAGEELWFENPQGYKVQLVYDKFLNNTTTAKLQEVPQLVTATSRSRRPDILISLYDKNEQFLTSMVVEVKYRKIKHIYKEEAESDVLQQLLDYEGLRYYNPTQKPLFKSSVVSKVVTIYPEQCGASAFVDENYGYSFIPVEPISYEPTIKGFNELKLVFEEFLDICG